MPAPAWTECPIGSPGPAIRALAAALLAAGIGTPARGGETLGEIRLLSLSEADGTAVVRAPGGDLEVVAAGDLLPGTSVRILEVLPDRLVLEDAEEATPVRLWMFRDRGEGARLQRLDREPPPLAPLAEPRPQEASAEPPPAEERED